MFKISENRPIGAGAIIYRELANLLQEMYVYYKQPKHKLTHAKQVAWCYFEKMMVIEAAGWLHQRQSEPPVVDLYMSGLSVGELDKIKDSLSDSERVELALVIRWGMMSVCQKMHKDFKKSSGSVTPDIRSARRQLQKWCSQSGQEYRQLRNTSLPVEVELPAVSQTKRVRSGYMVSAGAW